MKGIGIVGLPGSGKTVFSETAEECGISVVRMGDCVIEKVKEKGLKITSENIEKIARKLREKHGKGIVGRMTVDKLREKDKKYVVIDGVRSLAEVRVFREFFSDFLLVAIFSPARVRYERVMERERVGSVQNKEQLRKRDKQELEFGVGNVLALADVMLVNKNKSYEEFKTECREKIKELKSDWNE